MSTDPANADPAPDGREERREERPERRAAPQREAARGTRAASARTPGRGQDGGAKAWSDFCDSLKQAGQIVMADDQPDDALTRAEGFRYLSRLTRASLTTFIEHNDPLAPVLQRVVHETVKMGSDNPDILYANATISGAHRYRITGTRGTVHYLSLSTQVGTLGRGAGIPPTGQIDTADLSVREDGSFEVILACDEPQLEPGQTWLPMSTETGTLIVRQVRHLPDQIPAELRIDRLGGDGRPSPLTADALASGLEQSSTMINGAAMLFASWVRMFREHENRLPRFDPEISNRFGGIADHAYYHSYWRLDDGQALIIDTTPPECDHWNFQLNNHWMESLDYRYFRIHVNSSTARMREDGSLRIVVAHRDPGVPNWIETAGHLFGTMCFRWVRPVGEPPEPRCRVVQLSEVGDLP